MALAATLLAFGFGNLAMLGWLVAAATPLIIHLWNQRKYREMPWAAMRFLLAALEKNSRRIRIEQWLLLFLRTALIICLVLAVAEPYLERSGLKFMAGQHVHKILVLDGSFSMGYRPTDLSRFERAKELAAQIVEESNQGDGFTLVLLSTPPRVVVGSPAFESRDFLEEIESLRLPHSGGDLPATLEKVEQLISRSRREHPRLEREEIYLISDLGKSTWMSNLGDVATVNEFRKRSRRLGDTASLVVVDVGQPASENLAVTSVRCTEPFVTVARDLTIEAEIKNFGRQELPHQLAELYVDGHRTAEASIDLKPSEGGTVSFRHRFDHGGTYSVEVRLKSDLLDIDNHRWMSVPVKESLAVLCVDGKPSGERFQGAADFLAVALAPLPTGSDKTWVRPTIVPESALVETELDKYDCVMLCNVGQFTAAESQVLEAYLKQGGGVVFWLGDQVQPESYNRQLGVQDRAQRGILPAEIGALGTKSIYHFNPLDYRHPMVSPFKDQERGGLLSAIIYQYFPLNPPKDSTARVALGIVETGEAVIVEQPVYRGRSMVVGTSASADWSTLAASPCFVPIAQEILASVVGGQLAERNVGVGQTLGGSLRIVSTQVPLSIWKPDGQADDVRLTAEGDGSQWTYSDTFESGLYAAEFGPPVSRRELFAVNVDTAESDLTQLDPEELKNDVWPGVDFVHQTTWRNVDDEPADQITRRGGLHRGLLYAVLALLLLETSAAWFFGRQRL